jgi:hypothetical protein
MTLPSKAPLALVAAVLLVAGPAARAAEVSVTDVKVVAAAPAAPLWAPPEPPRKKKKARPRTPEVKSAEAQAHAATTATLEAEVFGDGAGGPDSSVRREARPADDDDADTRPTALPVIAPHRLSFALGASMVGRNFGFNTQLQGESTFPRAGMAAAVETFPFAFLKNFISRLGFAGSIEREIGSAGASQPDGGSLTYPVSEGRWSVDIRYAFIFGQRFVLMPLAGFGHSGYDVQRRTETTPPSGCASNATQVCLPDVAVSHATVGANARFALSPAWGLFGGLAVLPAFGVGRARGALGADAAPKSALGFSTEVGVAWQLLDWLSLRAAIPVERYGYSWSGPTVPYSSASETYYSLVVGATVFTK